MKINVYANNTMKLKYYYLLSAFEHDKETYFIYLIEREHIVFGHIIGL